MTSSLPMDLVQLDRDHPGFRDPVYRERRNAVARVAMEYRRGDPLPDIPYVEVEHGVWREVWAHLAPLHAVRACRRYREGLAALSLPQGSIPQLREVNRKLGDRFQLAPVAGLVTPRQFLAELGHGVFLSTQYVRHHATPLYTPEPDVIHELIGHAPTLQDPVFAAVNRAFGWAASHTAPERMEGLIRLYWYTLEFGLVREDGQIKAYGAGLLSSFGELGAIGQRPQLLPFDIGRMIETPYDPTDYQPVLFLADDLDAALSSIVAFLTPR